MRILVTGAGGFLARAVIGDLHAAGHHVATLTRRPTSGPSGCAYVSDLRDPAQLQRALDADRFDAVCHLAALTKVRESRERPLDYWETNVTGTINLLRAVNPDAAVILASTAAVYGSDAEGALYEDLPARPGSPYAATKLAAEHIVAASAEARGARSVVLRCFNIAGAVGGVTATDTSRAFPALLAAAAGRSDAFRINGDGTALRDYVHICDVARAFRLAAESHLEGQHIYNVGSGAGLSLTELVSTARAVTGRELPVRHQLAEREPQRLVADIARISADLCWSPRRSTPHAMLTDAWNALAATSPAGSPGC